MFNAGKLRHRVTIQKPVETQDDESGAVDVVWHDVATVWAAIEPLSAREFIAAQAEDSRISARVTIRYRQDVTAKMRLFHAAKGVYYDIHGVLADKDSGLEYLTLPVSEGVKYQSGQPDAVLPVVLEYPTITGTAQDGQTLTASTGLWANEPTGYAYQWYINDLPVDGATAASWIVDADVNDIITVGVVAGNTAGDSAEAFSDGVLIIT